MLSGLVALIVCQFAGEVIVRLTGLPVPGPVLGLMLMALLLLLRPQPPQPVALASEALLRHLSLFFVPAGVGALRYADLLAREGLRLAIVLVVSTAVTLAVTALVFRAVAGRATAKGEPR